MRVLCGACAGRAQCWSRWLSTVIPMTFVVPPCLCQAPVFQFFLYKAHVQDLKARKNSIFQRLLKGPAHERCRKSRHIHLTSYLGTSLQTYQSSTLQGVSYYNFFSPYLEVVTDLLLNSLLKKVGARLQKNGSTSWTGVQHMLRWVHPGSVFSHCKRAPLISYWKKAQKRENHQELCSMFSLSFQGWLKVSFMNKLFSLVSLTEGQSRFVLKINISRCQRILLLFLYEH